MEFLGKTTADGKPGISVYDHMVNVGYVAKCIAELSPLLLTRFQLSPSLIGALAALHDLGKISPGFQMKCPSWLEDNNLTTIARNGCWDTMMEADHGRVSHSSIQEFLDQEGLSCSISKYIAAALGAHHGTLKARPNDRGIQLGNISAPQSGIDWDSERQSNALKIWNHFMPENGLGQLDGKTQSLWWLAGLSSVADWIGSDERCFSPNPVSPEQNIKNIAKEALDFIGFGFPEMNRGMLFENIFGFPPNEMQKKAFQNITEPGVYIIEAPMGMGKTEAALYAAYKLIVEGKATGIYFALPTQATSNRIYLRLNSFLEKAVTGSISGRLIHGNSWLMQDSSFNPASNGRLENPQDDARNGRDWFCSTKRALLAPFGVGTVDQALLAVVAAKHFFVRRFALAGKVVILDEIHSYDIYTGTLIDILVPILEELGCTVIVLSATLTVKRRNHILSITQEAPGIDESRYPLISGRREGQSIEPLEVSPPKEKKIRVDFLPQNDCLEKAIEFARKNGAVLWICNTVGNAQKQYDKIKTIINNELPVGLLHSRFPFWRREEIENEWMKRLGKAGETRCGSILVSTQIVEQSVDLDADLMITELAPTDMLLQRMGRLWRHDRGNRPVKLPKICIIEEENSLEDFRTTSRKDILNKLGAKGKVYAPYILLRTLEVWKGQAEITIPTQIRGLLEMTYKDKDEEPEEWKSLAQEWFGTDSAKKMLASRNSNIWQSALDDKEGVQTRLNELQTVSMALVKQIQDDSIQFVDGGSCRIDNDNYYFPTAKALFKNMVKVPLHHFETVVSCLPLDPYIYESKCFGMVGDDGTITANGLKNGISMFYSNEMGLYVRR